jgi:hypothetical protein
LGENLAYGKVLPQTPSFLGPNPLPNNKNGIGNSLPDAV